jgi:hypothetical protein
MALTTITGNMVSVNAIQGTLIADNAITAVHIASNAVTSIQIAENNVTAREIASNSITVAQLADASVESDKIANGVITTNHLNSAMISSQTEVTAVAGDFVLLGDTSDSNNLKKTPVSSIVALAGVADGAITSAKLDTNIAVGGTLTVGSHLLMGDNDIIKLGAGTDLQIYHDGSASIITDVGTGDLRLLGNNLKLGKSDNSATYLYATENGSVELYYASAKKLETTSGGIDVTGTTTMDGLTVDGSGTLSGNLLVGAPSASAKLTVGTFGDTARAAQFHGGSILVDGGAASEIIIGDGNVAYMSIQTTDDATAMKIRNFSGSADLVTIERASGKVGIGTSDPDTLLELRKDTASGAYGDYPTLSLRNDNAAGYSAIHFQEGSTQRARVEVGNNSGTPYMGLYTTSAASGIMIKGGGNVGIGTAGISGVRLYVDGIASEHAFVARNDTAGYAPVICDNQATSGTRYLISFRLDNTEVGKITSTGSSTNYETSSDYRLKENVDYTWDATTRLKQLKPARFNWIRDESNTLVDGFLAHEVEDIVPEAITGTKDAMRDEEYEVTPAVLDDDGNVVTEAVMGTRSVPDYQGIDQAKLVPLLVKTIQELEARIETLENA